MVTHRKCLDETFPMSIHNRFLSRNKIRGIVIKMGCLSQEKLSCCMGRQQKINAAKSVPKCTDFDITA